MKKKIIEAMPPVTPSRKTAGYVSTVQMCGEILVLNVFKEGELIGRHAISTETGEYAQYQEKGKEWNRQRYARLMDRDVSPYGYYSIYEARKEMDIDTEEQRLLAKKALLRLPGTTRGPVWDMLEEAEQGYNYRIRKNTEENRINRINALMNQIPELPDGIWEWISRQEPAGDYLIYDTGKKNGHCTCCGGIFVPDSFGTEKIRNGSVLSCPGCGKRVVAKTRVKSIKKKNTSYLLQNAGGDMAVLRCMDTLTERTAAGTEVYINESARIILQKGKQGRIYYNQYSRSTLYHGQKERRDLQYWDDRHNCGQRKLGPGPLYPAAVKEILEGTDYAAGSRAVSCLADAGKQCGYAGVMEACRRKEYAAVIEYLHKGKFCKLLEETLEKTSHHTGMYYGNLYLGGNSLETVFGLADRQNINRIRQKDGGERMLYWLRRSEKGKVRIPDTVLDWLCGNGLEDRHTALAEKYMSLTQIMNYVIRQQASGYQGRTVPEVMEQWNDYMIMLGKLGKKADLEMMYRTADLRRRHEECVAQLRQIQILEEMKRSRERDEEEARRMRERFPGAEEILWEIRPKYEYESKDYRIIVPGNLMEIIREGTALHHCAGVTDRYFDRIVQRETYICFLREKQNPDLPYYTIEVEPGGTIRQHRGMYDEEPDIERIRPFLKEWQQHIKKGMGKKDRELAETSRRKRETNILELREQNRRHVLQGLMEDLMEV